MFTLIFSLWLSFHANSQEFHPFLYSPQGEEMKVSFKARYLTEFKNLAEMNATLPSDRSYYASYTIEPTLKYLFGPLTHRGWGGIKKTLAIDIDWTRAIETPRGVELSYSYQGLWILHMTYLDRQTPPIALPYNTSIVFSDDWKKCTDSRHGTESFYWYYWEPKRYGCDHKEGVHFQNVNVSVSHKSVETQKSFPEYRKMIKNRNGQSVFAMTFAFGYAEENPHPKPETDSDAGAREYQRFIKELRRVLDKNFITDTPIMRSAYPYFKGRDYIMGHKFTFRKDLITYEIKVVMNSDIDQMFLFARSFAQEHDSYFAWLGHSRVGSGFDAARFANLLREQPMVYSISQEYQIIYWGGCNSYSYYTDPFFQLKAAVSGLNDPNGTKGLDIIANGLPSYFMLNSANALIHVKAFLLQENPTSYQDLLSQMETLAERSGTSVLAVVLGDEDNY